MKKIHIALALLCLIALPSCRKSGVNLFVGDYSFKTSGEVSLTVETSTNNVNVPIPAILSFDLANDVGQLNISVSDKENDEVLVVINYLNGDIVVTKGTCDDKTIELDEFQRDFLPISLTTLTINPTIKVSGTGKIYDENTIVFDMSYNGKITVGSTTYKIKDKNIQMVAYRN